MSTVNLLDKIRSYEELINSNNEPLKYIVERLLPENFLLLIAGRRGKRKSLIALVLALCIATGRRFLNWEVEKTSVLYLDLENSKRLISKRLRLLTGLTGEITPIVRGLEFILQEDIGSFSIEKSEEKLREACVGKVLVIDSLSKVHRQDENSNSAMTYIMQKLVSIARTDCKALVVIHNMGKNNELGARGASSIEDSADVVLEVASNADVVGITCTKHRDANEADLTRNIRFTFTPERISIEDITREELSQFIRKVRALPEDSFSSQNRIVRALRSDYPHNKIYSLLRDATMAGHLTATRVSTNTLKYALKGRCSLCPRQEGCMLTHEQRKLCEAF